VQALAIQQLCKTYKTGHQALKGIDLHVAPGDFFALLGPNGAGKSTTIGIITGLVNKTSGTISVFGHDIDRDWAEAKRCIGVVPQEFNFSQFEPVMNIVVNQAGFYGVPRKLAKQRAERYLNELKLWDKRRDAARTLSGGQKRRLMIARALLHEPRLLILDEPTAGVDIEVRRSMWEFLKQINSQGTTIILTTHYLEEAESLCRNIAIIDQGRIIENTSMKRLLAKLNMETFVLDLRQHITRTPAIAGYDLRLLDETRLEADVTKERSLNELFQWLTEHGIDVISMRNKTNRLEELFMSVLDKNAKSGGTTVPE
jgi:ABC-2 type transport system ATP-binding protein